MEATVRFAVELGYQISSAAAERFERVTVEGER